MQTRSVLSRAGRQGISALTAREESARLHNLTGRPAGNGSLMRPAPLALAYLDVELGLVRSYYIEGQNVGAGGPCGQRADAL